MMLDKFNVNECLLLSIALHCNIKDLEKHYNKADKDKLLKLLEVTRKNGQIARNLIYKIKSVKKIELC